MSKNRNTSTAGTLHPNQQQQDKWLANQAANRAQIDHRNFICLSFHGYARQKHSTTTDYHTFEYEPGIISKEYIPKLDYNVVKPNRIDAKLIFKQILISNGYTGSNFVSLRHNLQEDRYAVQKFNNVTNEKVVAYLIDDNIYYVVTEDDYINYVDNNKTVKPKRVAKFQFIKDAVYEIFSPMGSDYIVITGEPTAKQAEYQQLYKNEVFYADPKKYVVNINGEAVVYGYLGKCIKRLRLNINSDWCYDLWEVTGSEPVGYEMAVWRDKQIDSILND